MDGCGHPWTPLGDLRIRRLGGVRVAPGALAKTLHHKGFLFHTSLDLLTFVRPSLAPKVSGEKMSGEEGGLDCACLVEQVAGVVEQSEMPTVDVVPVLLTG